MIRTDPRFWQSIKVNAETIPLEIAFATTQVSLKEIHPGIYRAKRKPAAAEERKEPLDNSDVEAAAAEEQEKFREQLLEHLEQMEKQPKLNEEEQKKLLETVGSRESMGKLSGFKYKEHLDFSAMDNAASTLPGFPVGWNLNKLPGRLTELLKDTEPIYGVSTSFCYAGTLATWSMSHVENGDLLSANILLENSAGKVSFSYICK
uniref:Uncharacterized protein n=1 Tax=Panagrolaimus davidi TaxID=227884 RepID=A0A914Q3G9_9BILA